MGSALLFRMNPTSSLLLLCLAGLVAAQAGIWSTTPDANGCRMVAQLYTNNFLSYGVGAGSSCNRYAMFGTFTIAPGGLLFVQVTGSFGNGGTVGSTITESYSLAGGNLRVQSTNPSFDITYSPSRSTFPQSGAWVSDQNSDGTKVYVQCLDGLFLSYVYKSGTPNMDAYFGTYTYDDATKEFIVDYSGSTESGFALQRGFTYSTTADGWTLTPNPANSAAFTFKTKPAVTDLEGVWVGSVDGCQLTVQFNQNVYRSFFTRCATAANVNTQLGYFERPSASSMTVYYFAAKSARADFGPYTFTTTLNDAKTSLRIQSTTPSVDVTVYRIVSAPSSVQLTIVLTGDFANFDKPAFVSALAAFLQIDASRITVTAASAGTARAATIKTTVVIADTGNPADPSAASLVGKVSTAASEGTSIGGYPVASVTNDTPATSSASALTVCMHAVVALVALVLVAVL
eukprot:Amastigsp_a339623_167.p1 type:complete len:458 gc:universal Amastigsp_a339623_167:1-1374(+)